MEPERIREILRVGVYPASLESRRINCGNWINA